MVRDAGATDTLEARHVEWIIYAIRLTGFLRSKEERIEQGLVTVEVLKNIYRRDFEEPPVALTAPLPEPRKRLHRRQPTLRKLHQFCPSPRNGLYNVLDKKGNPTAADMVLTHGCGRTARCTQCASLDRQSRYDDLEYALGQERLGTPLYLIEFRLRWENEDDKKAWDAFTKNQRDRARSMGVEMRRWVHYDELPDGSTVNRVITPIPHRKAKLLDYGEALDIVRKLCDGMVSRGERRSTARCWGAWMQEKRPPKYQRVCMMPADLEPFREFLRANAIDYQEVLVPRGTLYRRIAVLYRGTEAEKKAQAERVRRWIKDSKMSSSGGNTPDKDIHGDGGIDFSEYDKDFRPEGGREWRETG
jgi:hypothetical protein